MIRLQTTQHILRTINPRCSIAIPPAQLFSTSLAKATISPYQKAEASRHTGSKHPSRRASSTTATATATQTRPIPSPAFNQLSYRRNDPSPLQNVRTPEMDESFVGLTGGEIFHEMMLRQGVKHIFGYPGGAILPVFDAIYNSKHFDFILPRHEQGAGHMAEGYARASGQPGVVLVTSGPGATNVVTPMQDALSDGTPLVVFCGQVPTSAIGTDAFQEADVIGISRACTKWNVMVKNVAELPVRIKEAFEIATSGRPGPVLVDLPKDVTAAILRKSIPMASTLPAHPSAATLAAREHSRRQLEAAIKRVANLIGLSKKPILYVGQGMIATPEGPQLLKELAEKASIPVTTTLQGLGAFDELDPKSLHMLGMHGSAYANMAMQEADLIIALGARFDDRVTGNIVKFAPQARLAAQENRGGIVHFEIMPKNINKVVQATEAVEGDVATNLALLLPHVAAIPDRTEWFDQIKDWKERFPFAYEIGTSDGLIKPQALIEELSDMTASLKKDTVITTGVGQHQMWAAQHFRWRHPRTMVTSGGLGTMGYGLPAAIGAKVARPDALVIDIDGDASFNMTLTELSTAAQFNIGVKIIVMNNEEQGMVTQWQNLFYEDRYAHTHQKNPNFVKLAEAMDVQARRCAAPEDVTASLDWLINSEGPALLEVVTDKKVPVLPMVPAGKALHEFLIYNRDTDQARKALMRKRFKDNNLDMSNMSEK
ncbi:MAG: Acetolactate synthase, mitochondrial [Vezdaea acicularis]|nr:MAG: Acetolactate synthase, mitochondrial [Vezdaea acicularis]